jgi:hypothetical protein
MTAKSTAKSAAEHDVKTFKRKRDAERWLEEEQARRLRGEARDSAQPFRELVATWERTRAAKLAPKARERYASVMRKYLLPEWGSTPLAKLDRPTIKQWFADLDAKPGTAKPKRIGGLFSRLPERAREAIERRNAKHSPPETPESAA